MITLKKYIMKKLFSYFPFLIFGSLLICLEACTHDAFEDTRSENEKEKESIDLILISGKWEISNFSTSGINKTSDFTYYEFTFTPSGILQAALHDTVIHNGSWEISYEDDDGDIELEIEFESGAKCKKLDKDWEVDIFTNTNLKLEDEGDVLTFTKK